MSGNGMSKTQHHWGSAIDITCVGELERHTVSITVLLMVCVML